MAQNIINVKISGRVLYRTMMLLACLIVLIVILLIYYAHCCHPGMKNIIAEHYRSCRGCGTMKRASALILNPYILPYSGDGDTPSARIIEREPAKNEASGITHHTTPDHVELV
jgi:hypothetical protein